MAGYYLYSLDTEAFSQLTAQPTDDQARLAAQGLLRELGEFAADELDATKLTKDPDTLAPLVKRRLASADWYGDLTYHEAVVWDGMLRQFSNELGKQLKHGFERTSDLESIYWDCANAANDQGATMMAEPSFGNSGFRYFCKPTSDWNPFPMYTFYEPQRVRELLARFESVTPWFESQGGETEEEFLVGLLIPVQNTAAAKRILWVQTET